MKLYHVEFSFEIDLENGDSSILYSDAGTANKEARRILIQKMSDMKSDVEFYESGYVPPDLTATVSLCTAGPINSRVLCQIINSNGGRWMESARALYKLTMTAKRKIPKKEML